MRVTTRITACLLGAGLLLAGTARAGDWTDDMVITGFASAVYQRTNESTFLYGPASDGGIDDKGSFYGSTLGINLTSRINYDVTLFTQLLAEYNEDDYNLHIDWAFVRFEIVDDLFLRAGKIKFPVGLVNEYADVRYAYPWITAPNSLYSTQVPIGPQATRNAYSGASLLWDYYLDDFTLEVDLFAGEVKMEVADVRQLVGFTGRVDWNELVQFQASAYQGTMANGVDLRPNGKDMTVMNDEPHRGLLLGFKADWNDVVVYAEIADVKMGDLSNMKVRTWYTTLGYRLGKWLPHVTFEDFDRGYGKERQQFLTLGLRYDVKRNTAIKLELGQVRTEKGTGLFVGAPADQVYRGGLAIDVVF